MTDRSITGVRRVEARPARRSARDTTGTMSAFIDGLVARNPLLGHGPRTHANGIAVPSEVLMPVRARARRRPLDVDAPKVHLGHAGRAV